MPGTIALGSAIQWASFSKVQSPPTCLQPVRIGEARDRGDRAGRRRPRAAVRPWRPRPSRNCGRRCRPWRVCSPFLRVGAGEQHRQRRLLLRRFRLGRRQLRRSAACSRESRVRGGKNELLKATSSMAKRTAPNPTKAMRFPSPCFTSSAIRPPFVPSVVSRNSRSPAKRSAPGRRCLAALPRGLATRISATLSSGSSPSHGQSGHSHPRAPGLDAAAGQAARRHPRRADDRPRLARARRKPTSGRWWSRPMIGSRRRGRERRAGARS